MKLTGAKALITGGASGIGFATAARFVADGADVLIVDIDESAAQAAGERIGARSWQADVSDGRQVRAAFEHAESIFGKLDIAFLNAGITLGESTDIETLTDDHYRRILGVNVNGVVFGVREAVGMMRRFAGGSIVATASIAGINSYPVDPIYSLTKHAVVGFVRSVAPLLEADGISINCICPGVVETPLVGEAAKRILKDASFPLIKPEDVAEAVVRAVLDETTGQAWVIQPGREPMKYEFRGVPGPRTPGAEGMLLPDFRTSSKNKSG